MKKIRVQKKPMQRQDLDQIFWKCVWKSMTDTNENSLG
jgi:hypothetical protein